MAQTRNQKRNEIIKKTRIFLEQLREEGLPVSRAYLYGSWSKRQASSASDIDLAVISSKFTDPWRSTAYLWEKASLVDTRIEPIAYHPKDFVDTSPLVWEIRKHGLRII